MVIDLTHLTELQLNLQGRQADTHTHTHLAGGTVNVSRITFLIGVTNYNFLSEDVTGVHL